MRLRALPIGPDGGDPAERTHRIGWWLGSMYKTVRYRESMRCLQPLLQAHSVRLGARAGADGARLLAEKLLAASTCMPGIEAGVFAFAFAFAIEWGNAIVAAMARSNHMHLDASSMRDMELMMTSSMTPHDY